MSSIGNRKNSEKKERSESVAERPAEKRKRQVSGELRTKRTGKKGKSRKQKLLRFVRKNRKWLICAAAAILVAWLVSKFFVQLVLIRDASMEPAYHNGQIVAAGKLQHAYQTGDVVVFYAPQLGCRLVKRIAHVPNDVLEPLEASEYGLGTLAGYTVPEGAYLVLGDNTEESVDSRDKRVGVVRAGQIEGRLLW